ncbi:MAG: hypothetical protein AABX65_02180 [Nanoarchaeota archaeon]
MRKLYTLILLITLFGVIGIIYYFVNSPFTIDNVKIPDNIDIYTKVSLEDMTGVYVENFMDRCKYATYNPESSLNHVYVCKSKSNPKKSIGLWIDSQIKFLNQGKMKFLMGENEINNVKVRTITLSSENCGNPGFCTTYYWKQGRIIFSSNTLKLVEGFIENKENA